MVEPESSDLLSMLLEKLDEQINGGDGKPAELPVLATPDIVLFPHMVMPLMLTTSAALAAARQAWGKDRLIIVLALKHRRTGEPSPDDMYTVGTLARLMQLLEPGDTEPRAVVEGLQRVRITDIPSSQPYIRAQFQVMTGDPAEGPRAEATMRVIRALFAEAADLSNTVPAEATTAAANFEEAGQLCDLVAAYLGLQPDQKQQVLEAADGMERLTLVESILEHELQVLRIESEIHHRVRAGIEEAQREYYLREQLRVIQTELGEREGVYSDVMEYRERLETAGLSPEALEKAHHELDRLERMPAMSPEVSVIRTFLDWLLGLPWQESTEDVLDVAEAQAILDEDHFGLRKVKDRVLEFLAIRKLVAECKGPILCFIGPPGVGKTSIGRSIARAMGRKFIRISLGGVHDEAEIRGHRRTYVGAMPGRIIQTIRRVGSNNPVFMIDEIDKIGVDFRGDPTSALLEVLDPEQNDSFQDHYLEVPFDLSRVFFVATGNYVEPMPPALLDRMEIIEFPGYIEEEKLQIAKRFLAPKQRKAHGLAAKHVRFGDRALRSLIRHYTSEAGVRNLEREIAGVCRKIARRVASGETGLVRVNDDVLQGFLGPRRYRRDEYERREQVGVAHSLAFTWDGGDVIAIEVAVVDGSGDLVLTGHLGEVMKESAQAALGYARQRAQDLGLDGEMFARRDIHIHVPAGAVPKEGPSAGIAIATALVSALTGRKVRNNVAMTGEVTLHGRVLRVGGIREKVLAAHRAGMKIVMMPAENEPDLTELDDVETSVREDVQFIFVTDMQQVLDTALAKP
jgi:ATP-dependent Lon protease